MRILIAVGTEAAARLADAVADLATGRARIEVLLRAGTPRPTDPRVRVSSIDLPEVPQPWTDAAGLVVDGLDPFDTEAAIRLRTAARRSRTPVLTLRPPVWERHPLDRWIEVRSVEGAAAAARSIARIALLALPPDDLGPFEAIEGMAFQVRLPRAGPADARRLPPRFSPVAAPAPSHMARECAILRQTGAQTVVLRATGGAALEPLVAAARALDLPVVMIRRPGDPPGPIGRGRAPLDRPSHPMDGRRRDGRAGRPSLRRSGRHRCRRLARRRVVHASLRAP